MAIRLLHTDFSAPLDNILHICLNYNYVVGMVFFYHGYLSMHGKKNAYQTNE